MGRFVTLGLFALTSQACLSEEPPEPASPAPGPNDYDVRPAFDYARGPVAPPSGARGGGDVASGVVESGRLEGTLTGVSLAHDTQRNYGYLDEYDGQGVLDVTVAAQGFNGAGMIMLNLPGGLAHPVFQTGRFSSSERASGAPVDPGSDWTPPTWVASCAGPQLDEYPFEDESEDYDMTATIDESDPGSVVLVVAARFSSYPDRGASDVTATIRLDVGEEAVAGLAGLH